MASIKADKWIRKMALEHRMIEPFEDRQVRAGVVSYGLSSYGYDIRVADEFKVFTNINSTVVDPKNFDSRSFAHNEENNVCFYDRPLAEELDAIFAVDAKRCKRIELETWRRRGWFWKLQEFIAAFLQEQV